MDPLDPDNTNNQVILILKYYLYKFRYLCDKPSINGGLKYRKYCIKIEKTTLNFLSSTQRDYICKKWLPFEIVLGVLNFSVLLQNVCFDELNVYRLCKLYIHVICVCICICLCFSLKINKLQKKIQNTKKMPHIVICQPSHIYPTDGLVSIHVLKIFLNMFIY